MPKDGAYTYGMFIEGCKWDYNKCILAESDDKVLFVDCPLIFIIPFRMG